jgi:hypothetical protein
VFTGRVEAFATGFGSPKGLTYLGVGDLCAGHKHAKSTQ